MTGDSLPLRPLSIGELFDRAVTLYARNFVLFSLIMLVAVLPTTIASYFATFGNSSYQQILQQATHPGRVPPRTELASLLQFESTIAVVVLLAIVILPYALIAIVTAVSKLYRAERPTFAQCYRAALVRWPSVLGVTLLEILILGGVIMGGAIVFGVTAAVAALATRGSLPGIAIALILFFGIGLVWLLALGLCWIAMGFAFNAVGIEGASVSSAIGSGFVRIFSGRELGRAVLVILATGAIYIGLYIVSMVLAALIGSLTHSMALLEVVTAPLSWLSSTFIALIFAVYYFDVRVRREGLDLQSAIDRLEPQTTV